MEVARIGSRPSRIAPAENFTGTVRVDPLFQPPGPSRSRGSSVTFEPGARTAWHKHPFGQALIITAGFGRVQSEGHPVQEVRPGDVVWISPGEMHWHGASDHMSMTHIAIAEHLDGLSAEWGPHVTDEQFCGPVGQQG